MLDKIGIALNNDVIIISTKKQKREGKEKEKQKRRRKVMEIKKYLKDNLLIKLRGQVFWRDTSFFRVL